MAAENLTASWIRTTDLSFANGTPVPLRQNGLKAEPFRKYL